jgi:plasmid stabilization system protein ParE
MKYIARPKAWFDLEEIMTHLRIEAGEETAVRFWQRARETTVEIIRVRHGMMDLPEIFAGDENA